MLYYVITMPDGVVVSREEKVLRTKDGLVSATYVQEGGHMLPFRSILAAYRHIRDRETRRWDTKTTFRIRRGMVHGFYVVAHHHTHMFRKDGRGQNTEYLIIPTPMRDVSVTTLGSGRILEPGDRDY